MVLVFSIDASNERDSKGLDAFFSLIFRSAGRELDLSFLSYNRSRPEKRTPGDKKSLSMPRPVKIKIMRGHDKNYYLLQASSSQAIRYDRRLGKN